MGFCGNQLSNKIAHKFQELRDAKWFQTAIIMVIFVAGALVGIQTYDVEGKGIRCVAYTCGNSRCRTAGWTRSL